MDMKLGQYETKILELEKIIQCLEGGGHYFIPNNDGTGYENCWCGKKYGVQHGEFIRASEL